MYHIIYKLTNTINNKIYIGSHKTNVLNDGYMGSGKYLANSKNKYGIDKFSKTILYIYDNSAEMQAKEAEMVNEEFVKRKDNYNLKIGGSGGWDYINTILTTEDRSIRGKVGRKKADKTLAKMYGDNWRTILAKKGAAKRWGNPVPA